MHENQDHSASCFITLTYSPENLPTDGSLHKKHYQDFMKRLRKHFLTTDGVTNIRYFHCGEYGEQTLRPHYHAIIFGIDFTEDQKPYSRNAQGQTRYRSALLDRLWTHGLCEIGTVTPQSCAYVARYVMKKITGHQAHSHYQGREPEYVTMSLKPGIGKRWFDRFSSDIFPRDETIIKGHRVRTPRYYDQQLEKVDPAMALCIKNQRKENALKNAHNNTPERLEVRKEVFVAKTKNLTRSLE